MAIDIQKIKDIIDIMREPMQADGGDIVFVDCTEDGIVSVELVGSCAECAFSTLDLQMGVERILKERVPGITQVVAVNI